MADGREWVARFTADATRHAALDGAVDWGAPVGLDAARRRVLGRSLARFQVGEDGDGAVLVAAAHRAGDPDVARAVELFVAQEQQHAALLSRLLVRLGADPVGWHWSDAAFVRLRRVLGLRTELAVLLVAELVALEYYGALAAGAPDPVVRAVAARVLADEQQHVVFHVERLRAGGTRPARPVRAALRGAWWAVALGATAVLVVDHGAALTGCGRTRRAVAAAVLRRFAAASGAALGTAPSAGPFWAA